VPILVTEGENCMSIPVRLPKGAATLLTKGQQAAIEAFYSALGTHDMDLLDVAVLPDWEDIPMSPGQAPGPNGLKPILLGLISALPDLAIEIREAIAAPNRVAIRAVATATHGGELFGIPATGRRVVFSLHEFHEFDGDRIRRTWHMEDLFGLFTQIGRWPPMHNGH
jgi:predicted ester cyclase